MKLPKLFGKGRSDIKRVRLQRRPPFYLQKRSSRAGHMTFFTRIGQAIWSERNADVFIKDGYQGNPIVYRCARLNAQCVAAMPWMVEKNGELTNEHAVLDLLRNPNPLQTQLELIEAFITFLDISGNSFMEFVDEDGEQELYVLPSPRFRMIPAPNGLPEAFEYSVGGQKMRFPMTYGFGKQLPLLHMRYFHPMNDAYGMSPLEPAGRAIDTHNQASDFQKSVLENGGAPSGALVYKGPKGDGVDSTMEEEDFALLKAELEEQYTGPENAGRPMVLDGGLEWVSMGSNLKDLDFVNGKRESAREIALSHGVPPMLLGIPGDNSYANYSEANRAHHRQTILPLADRFRFAFTKFLRPTFGDDWTLAYDIDQIPALEIEREMNWKKVAAASWLSDNDKREATGYGKSSSPNADKLPSEIAAAARVQSAGQQGDRGADRGEREPRDLSKTAAGSSDA